MSVNNALLIGCVLASQTPGHISFLFLEKLKYLSLFVVSIFQVNCETDFVAKNEKFRNLALNATVACLKEANTESQFKVRQASLRWKSTLQFILAVPTSV